jgi:hypothetical protein
MSLVAHAYDVLLPFYMVINLSSPPPLPLCVMMMSSEPVATVVITEYGHIADRNRS